MKTADREFLFNYRFGGAEWGISIFAADAAEAKEKIKAVARARYEGEIAIRIPAGIPAAGFFVRGLTRFKNWRATG